MIDLPLPYTASPRGGGFRSLLNSGRLWVSAHFLASLAILAYLQKSAFPGRWDGFTFGMYWVVENPMSEWPELVYVHAVRLIAVWPLWVAHTEKWPVVFQALSILLVLLPIVRVRVGEEPPNPWRVLVLYMPCFFSFRATLASAAIAYLYLILMTPWKPLWALLLSALEANLSSGVVVLWVGIVGVCHSRFGKARPATIVLGALLASSLFLSVKHKIGFFSDPQLLNIERAYPGEYGGPTDVPTAVKNASTRSTIAWSLKNGQWLRPAAYAACFAVLVGLIVYALRREGFTGPHLRIFAIMIPGFLVEGLGVAACVLTLALVGLERKKLILPRPPPVEKRTRAPEPATSGC
jgi:hypothetical protein